MFADKTNTFVFSFKHTPWRPLKELGMSEHQSPAAPFHLLLALLHAAPRGAPPADCWGPDPSSHLLRARASGSLRSWWVGSRREMSKVLLGAPSQNCTLEFVGACGSIPSPFGLFLLLLAFLRDLLPVLGGREGGRGIR